MDAKKSLGQNFLRDKNVVEKIISAVSACSGEVIVEVGPGEGVLTERLAESGATVIAVELDDRLIPVLKEKFRNFPNVYIVHEDILDIDMREVFLRYGVNPSVSKTRHLPSPTPSSRGLDTSPRAGEEGEEKMRYRLVGNLPYYITSPIIRKFLEGECPPTEMFLMTQKEVAERICAKPGKMSILAVAVQYYADPELLFAVPKESFDPVPKVASAFIKIENRKKKIENKEKEKEFFRVVKIGFSARRKTLANNLANGFCLEKADVVKRLAESGIPEKARAQDVSVEEWKIIINNVKRYV